MKKLNLTQNEYIQHNFKVDSIQRISETGFVPTFEETIKELKSVKSMLQKCLKCEK